MTSKEEIFKGKITVGDLIQILWAIVLKYFGGSLMIRVDYSIALILCPLVLKCFIWI